MTTWKHTLKIKHLLSGSNDPAIARETARNIAAAIRASTWHTDDVKRAGSRAESEVAARARAFGRARTLAGLNTALTDLYDLADADRVWIE